MVEEDDDDGSDDDLGEIHIHWEAHIFGLIRFTILTNRINPYDPHPALMENIS